MCPDDFWIIAQRVLIFEEPTCKWLHIKRALNRIARKQHNAETHAGRLPYFSEHSFPRSKQVASQILSILFAAEEMERLQLQAFERWQPHAQVLGLDKENNGALLPVMKVQSSKCSWLNLISNLAIPWHWLVTLGPWLDNAKATFIIDYLDSLASYKELPASAKQWQQLSADFKMSVMRSRATLPGNFLPNRIILVEGATETIILPALAKCFGIELSAAANMIVACGGAGHMVRKYTQLKDVVSIPIFCLLDRDAEEQRLMLTNHLRPQDRLYFLEDGEIEDIFQLEFFVYILNRYLNSLPFSYGTSQSINPEDLEESLSRTSSLEKLWRRRELGKFDKVGFADFVANNISRQAISDDGRSLIKSLSEHGV